MRPTAAALLAGLAASLALAPASPASVRRVSFTATVPAGKYAALSVRVAPTARCTITVVYDTVTSHARGLGAKRGGPITWRWRVGSATHPGRWPVSVNCGKSGKLHLRLHVTS
jgi:hypothetical protein